MREGEIMTAGRRISSRDFGEFCGMVGAVAFMAGLALLAVWFAAWAANGAVVNVRDLLGVIGVL